MESNTPRGIRNHNPGNIRYNGTAWLGLANPPSDGAFCIFREPKFGIRALATILRNYKRKYGICSVSGIIARFAPSSENDTAAYIRSVCAAVGCGADTPLDTESEAVLLPLVKAIVRHENGRQPYIDEQIMEGLRC
ncbi:MAG: structural protein [Alphaproteobacteria bacterium]|nr:structural protein [Alphaproteobacteria bacterium]